MDLESNSTVIVKFDPNFPMDDILAISEDLTAGRSIVAGYVVPERGMLDLMVLEYAKMMGEATIILPDRNIVLR